MFSFTGVNAPVPPPSPSPVLATGDRSKEGLVGKENERDRGLCVGLVLRDLEIDDRI